LSGLINFASEVRLQLSVYVGRYDLLLVD